jgi:hypothetical protein
MKTFLMALIVLAMAFIISRAMGPALSVEAGALPTTEATAGGVETPSATVGPIVHGDPQRMRFQIGTYGDTYTAGTWVLWAAAGQTLTLAGADLVNAKLTAPNGELVLLEGNKAVLPASGDYILTVAGLEEFGIDIR